MATHPCLAVQRFLRCADGYRRPEVPPIAGSKAHASLSPPAKSVARFLRCRAQVGDHDADLRWRAVNLLRRGHRQAGMLLQDRRRLVIWNLLARPGDELRVLDRKQGGSQNSCLRSMVWRILGSSAPIPVEPAAVGDVVPVLPEVC